MLPFVRMLEYGNVAPVKSNIELYGTNACFFLFNKDTNILYGMGSSGSLLGLGGFAVYNNFVQVASNVKRIITDIDGGSSLFIYQGLDDRLYATGNSISMENGPTGTNYTVWTDITSIFSKTVFVNDIKHVQAYYNVKVNVVMQDGSLYCMGKNQPLGTEATGCFGNNTSVGSTRTLVKIPIENVTYAYGNMYLQSNGDLYCCGVNNKFQYGNGTITASSSLVKVAGGVKTMSGSYQCNYYISNSNDLYVCGTQFRTDFGNEMGTGSTTVNQNWSLLQPNVRSMATNIGNMSLHYIIDSNLVYGCGYNVYGWFGTGAEDHTYIPTQPNPLPTVGDNTGIIRNNNASILFSEDKLLISGRFPDGTTVLVYTEIAYPF